MSEVLLRRLLRTLAIVIALLAFLDPAITSDRTSKPEIVVRAVNTSADSALARTVSERLSKNFTVLNVPFAGAAATVLVGSHAPSNASETVGSVFGILPDETNRTVSVDAVQIPARAAIDARVPVTVATRVRGAKGQQLHFILRANNSVVDRVARTVNSDDERIEAPLSYVPTVAGAAALRVEAALGDDVPTAGADAVVDVRTQKWAVLFFDSRPSWMSTFVRRALELDTRFAITSRVVTSTNVSTDGGKPPGTLDDPTVSELYDAIVLGAPESLGERDLQGIEKFLRQRGGSVVLLFDGNKTGSLSRLADLGTFTTVTNSQPAVIADQVGDTTAMRATEWMFASRVPTGARVLAWTRPAGARTGADRNAIVYAMNAGAGRVFVSGALDAWKFRGASQSGFEKFWQQTIADAANSSVESVDLQLSTTPVLAGQESEIVVSSRRAVLAEMHNTTPVRSAASVSVELPSGRQEVRVWPTGSPGVFRGNFRAPTASGVYRVQATADGASAVAPLVVASNVMSANPSQPELLAAFASAHGGSVLPAKRLAELPGIMQSALRPLARRVVWHPMRSAWWLVPFALLLSAEWWLRRRRGLA